MYRNPKKNANVSANANSCNKVTCTSTCGSVSGGAGNKGAKKVHFKPQPALANIGCITDLCGELNAEGPVDDGTFAVDDVGNTIVNNDDGNVGRGIAGTSVMGIASVVGGFQSEASANYSVALGYRAVAASGDGAFAYGERTRASGAASGNIGCVGVDNSYDETVFAGGGAIQMQTEDTAVHAGRDGVSAGSTGGSSGVLGSGFMDFIPLTSTKTGTDETLNAEEIGPGSIVRLNATVTVLLPSNQSIHPGTTITLPAASEMVGPNGRWTLAKPGDSWIFTVENLGTSWFYDDLWRSSTAYLTPPSGGEGGWTFAGGAGGDEVRQIIFSSTVRFEVTVLNVGAGVESIRLTRLDNITAMPVVIATDGTNAGTIAEADGTLLYRAKVISSFFDPTPEFTTSYGGAFSFSPSFELVNIFAIASGKQMNMTIF